MSNKQKPTGGHRENRRKRVTAICLLALVVVAAGVGIAMRRSRPAVPTVALTIDGQRISEEEFKFAVNEVKNQVVMQMVPDGGEVPTDFWASNTKGSSAYAVADAAVSDLAYRYAFYDVAAQGKLIDSNSWTSVKKRYETENASREKKIENGEPVYGLTEYDMSTFVSYDMSRLEEQYVSDASLPGMELTDQQIVDHFNSKEWTLEDGSPATLDDVRPNVVMDLRRELFAQMVKKAQASEKIDTRMEDLASIVSGYMK